MHLNNWIPMFLLILLNGCSTRYTVVMDKGKIYPNLCNQNQEVSVDLEIVQYGELFHTNLNDLENLPNELKLIEVDGGLESVDSVFYCFKQKSKLILYKSGKVNKAKGLKGQKLYL